MQVALDKNVINVICKKKTLYLHHIVLCIYSIFSFFSFSVTGKEWQWAESRAWLGSRWVWLQTQVSELEYRIRALTELYTHLRQGKVFWVSMCVYFWIIMGGWIHLYFLCFVQVRSTYSVPDTPLRASNPSPASHNCKSVNDLTCIQTQTGPFLYLTFNVLLHYPLGCPQLVILTGSGRRKTPPLHKQCPVHLLLLHGFDRYSGNDVTDSFAWKIAQRWGQR